MSRFMILFLSLAGLGLIAAVAIPNFVKARTTSSMHSCLFHQLWIQKAKIQWAQKNGKGPEDTPTEAEVLEEMRFITPRWCGVKQKRPVTDQLPTCFLGPGKYEIGKVGEAVACTVATQDHTWDYTTDSALLRRHYD